MSPILSSAKTVVTPGISRVLNAAMLLKAPAHQLLLKNMRESLAAFVSDDQYNTLYDACVRHFCEYVQRLQATKASFYAHAGGMMDLGLDRARAALAIRTAYRKHKADPLRPAMVDPKEALWDYAIFTAALLMDLGRMVVQYDVTLCDQRGRFGTPWIPLSGSMLGQSHYYRIEPSEQDNQRLAEWVTPLLAEQVVPPEGLKWLGSDKYVLEEWLALLHGDFSGEGMIVKMILWAQAQVLSHYYADHGASLPFGEDALISSQHFDVPSQLGGETVTHPGGFFNTQPPSAVVATNFVAGGLPDSSIVPTVANPLGLAGSVSATIVPGIKEGVAFLRWLTKGMQAGHIGFKGNNPLLKRTTNGAIRVGAEAFRAYTVEHPGAANMRTVQQQLATMGVIASQAAGKNEGGMFINPYLLLDLPSMLEHTAGSDFINQFSAAHLEVPAPQ